MVDIPETGEITFVLDEGLERLWGKVVSGASARPIAGASIRVESYGDVSVHTQLVTDTNGRFLTRVTGRGRWLEVGASGHATRMVLVPIDAVAVTIRLLPCARIGGVVRAAESGRPLPGVVIESRPLDPLDGRTRIRHRTVSDGEGRFLLPSLTTGTVTVAAIGPDRVSPELATSGWGDGHQPLAVEIAAGEQVDIVIEAVRAVEVTGSVTCGERPVANAMLRLSSGGSHRVAHAEAAITGDNGRYRLPGLVPGLAYSIEVSAAGHATLKRAGFMGDSGDVLTADFDLPEPRFLTLRVVDEDGRAVPGARIEDQWITNDAGEARIGPFAGGDVSIYARCKGHEGGGIRLAGEERPQKATLVLRRDPVEEPAEPSVRSRETDRPAVAESAKPPADSRYWDSWPDLVLRTPADGEDPPRPGLSISGVVRKPEGEPVRGLKVIARRVLPSGKTSRRWWQSRTDESGQFVIAGLGPGEYSIGPGYVRGFSLPEARVAGAGEKDVELALRRGRNLVVRVVDPEGTPVPAVAIHVIKKVVVGSNRPISILSRRTDRRGLAVIGPLPAGRSVVMEVCPPDGDLAARAVAPDIGASEQLIRLERGLYIEGRVVDQAGRPVSNCVIEADSGTDGWFTAAWSRVRPFRDGRFRIGPFPPGEVWLEVGGSGDDTPPRHASVLVAAGRKDVVLIHPLGWDLEVVVRNWPADLRGEVWVRAGDGPVRAAKVVDGRAHLRNLAPGKTYRLFAWPPGHDRHVSVSGIDGSRSRIFVDLVPGRRVTGRILTTPIPDSRAVGCMFGGVFHAGRLESDGTLVIPGVPPEVTSVMLKNRISPFPGPKAAIRADHTVEFE